MNMKMTPEFREKLRREMPPFPENRKIVEGGDGFDFGLLLMLSPLVVLAVTGVFVLFDWLS